jgi:MYXO-CTERM domain-containing protein
VNDPKYGGSGGTVCVSSANEQSFEVLAHEIGHSLAFLADEYSYEGNQPPCDPQQDCQEANATLRTTLEQIKWHDWIEDGTPLPTPATAPYASVTGLFEGARYTPTGVYRPQLNCKMRDLGADYCAVCTEQFVRSIWTSDNIKMIETSAPAEPNVQSVTCDAIELSVTSPPIVPSTYRYTWTVDGTVQPETTRAISLSPGALQQGEHQVAVRVEDATSLVRTDLDNDLKDQTSWTVTVAKNDCPVPVGGTGGTGGVAGASAGGAVTAGMAGDADGAGGAGGAVDLGGSAGSVATAGVASGMAGGSSSGTPHGNPPPRETAGCGCALPGEASPRGVAWLLVLLGVALGRVRRERAGRRQGRGARVAHRRR